MPIIKTKFSHAPSNVRSLSQRKKVQDRQTIFKRKQDNYSRKLRRRRLINYLRSEFAISTIHGLPYVVKNYLHWCERLIWALGLCASVGLVNYLLSVQLARFIETPTVMSVEMDYFNWNVSYPAFTLCPLVKVDKNALSAIVNETNARTGKNLQSYLWTIVSANLEHLEMIDMNFRPEILSLIDPEEYTSLALSAFKKLDPTTITTNTNWPISVEIVMTELGMCHVVNSNVAVFDNPSKWTNSATTYTKDSIVLSVYDQDFFTQIMNYADLYDVYIHSPEETIVITTSKYTHSLQGFMSLGVQLWSTNISEDLHAVSIRLRKCRFINEPISERFPIYSYNRCMMECRIQMILKICGCIPHFYKPLPNEKICKINELKCVVDHKKEFQTLSASEKTLKKLRGVNGLPRNSRECGCVSLCANVVYQRDYENFIPQTDFTRLRIGISHFPKFKVVKEIIFSGYEIILKIGGAWNLCIGASIISMVEFVVTFLKLPIYWLVRNISDSFKRY